MLKNKRTMFISLAPWESSENNTVLILLSKTELIVGAFVLLFRPLNMLGIYKKFKPLSPVFLKLKNPEGKIGLIILLKVLPIYRLFNSSSFEVLFIKMLTQRLSNLHFFYSFQFPKWTVDLSFFKCVRYYTHIHTFNKEIKKTCVTWMKYHKIILFAI